MLGIDALPELRDAAPSDAGAETSIDAKPDVDIAWSRWGVDPNGPPTEQFDTSAETVFDTVTGLTWQRYVQSTQPAKWEDAAAGCAALSLGGKTGWRLPTRIELASITDYRLQMPASNPSVFPDTPNSSFWTASTYARDPASAWTCRFDEGAYVPADKQQFLRYRCVHD